MQILDDTSFARHFRRELVLERPPGTPFVADAEEFSFGGIILDRGDEVKLAVRSGRPPGGHDLAYFTPDGSGTALVRYILVREFLCGATCEIIEQRVGARYARR